MLKKLPNSRSDKRRKRLTPTHRLFHVFGRPISPPLFFGARDVITVAKRLKLAYNLVGVRVVKTNHYPQKPLNTGEPILRVEMIFLCPYRNLCLGRFEPKKICHEYLDMVDKAYADYLLKKSIVYITPQNYADYLREKGVYNQSLIDIASPYCISIVQKSTTAVQT